MRDRRRTRGMAGEEAAATFVEKLGWTIVARNFRTRYGELDIIAADGRVLVFCEVRARVGAPRRALGEALESIGPAKRAQLRRMAGEWFRAASAAAPRTRVTRFDAIAVALTADGRPLAIEHVRDAF